MDFLSGTVSQNKCFLLEVISGHGVWLQQQKGSFCQGWSLSTYFTSASGFPNLCTSPLFSTLTVEMYMWPKADSNTHLTNQMFIFLKSPVSSKLVHHSWGLSLTKCWVWTRGQIICHRAISMAAGPAPNGVFISLRTQSTWTLRSIFLQHSDLNPL